MEDALSPKLPAQVIAQVSSRNKVIVAIFENNIKAVVILLAPKS